MVAEMAAKLAKVSPAHAGVEAQSHKPRATRTSQPRARGGRGDACIVSL